MDPMTMMAIANTAMNIFGSMNQGQGKPQTPAPAAAGGSGAAQFSVKPVAATPLPPAVNTDYGSMIKNMMQQNALPQPGTSFIAAAPQPSGRLF